MMRSGSVRGIAVLNILWMASVVSASFFSPPLGNDYIVNDGSLNNQVHNGDIIRYVYIEENYEYALVFLNTGPPSPYVPANSTFYLSVIAKPGGDPSLWQTVWSANREQPVHENATIRTDSIGNLQLFDYDGTFVWSSSSTGSETSLIQLDLTGNLQLLDSSNATVWQSFDNPTDTLLPGQSLYSEKNSTLVSSISTISEAGVDLGSGSYRLAALPGGFALFVNLNNSAYYIQSAETSISPLNLTAVESTCLHPNNEFFDISSGLLIVTDETKISSAADPSLCGHGDSSNITAVIPATNPTPGTFTSQYARLDPDGIVRLYQYSINSRAFLSVGSIG